MRYIKILGLAAIAALAITAFVGAGSASATVLCKENVNPCPEGQRYEPEDVLKGTATSLVLTGSPTVTCTHSETTTQVTEPGGAGEAVIGEITNLSFTGCSADTFGNPSCTVKVEGIPYPAEITGSGGNGTLVVPGAEASVVCGGIISCVFGNELFELPITGGNPAKITASNVLLKKESGFFCPGETRWDAVYTAFGANTAAWVVAS